MKKFLKEPIFLLFGFLFRKIRFLASSSNNARGGAPEETPPSPEKLCGELSKNLEGIMTHLGGGSDVKIHRFHIGGDPGHSGALVYVDGLINNMIITEAILKPITQSDRLSGARTLSGSELLDIIGKDILCSSDTRESQKMSEIISGCLSGNTILLSDGCDYALIINSKGWDKRSVSEPLSEPVVRGPREGFTENLRTNTSLIRRKIKSGQLHVENMTVGRKTRTEINIMYLEGVADPKVVETVRYRIGRLEVDSILESGYIEEYINDAPLSPFATIGYSEKPDTIAACILEGRVAIVVDGTPFVLTVPMLFVESFQTAEDYYTRPLYASMIRLLRYIGYGITVFAPAIYIALTAFHQELIPTTLLFTISDAFEGTPFPTFLEVAIMTFSFEILYEAGIRLPRPVGQAVSIVGALIMGDAAVSAGLVGAPVVIAVAITAVSSFLVPNQNDSASILRIIMIIAASVLGWYGISIGFLAILVHLATLKSFGVDYFDGLKWSRSLEDSIVRLPLWCMTRRPPNIAKGDLTRVRFFVPPLRPYAGDTDDDEGGDGN